MSDEKIFIRDDVVVEILKKAGRDTEFKKMLFTNPPEALGQFGFVIPGSSGDGRNYLETVYAMYDRAEFYRLFHLKILNKLRDETVIMAPGPCVTTTEHEDVSWDFEVVNYASK